MKTNRRKAQIRNIMSEDKLLTKHKQITITSTDPNEIMGKFLTKNLLRTWKEDFADTDTGEIVTIERNELIAHRGDLINGDLLSRIMFHIQTNDISEIKASNQCRIAEHIQRRGMHPWVATIKIDEKKKKFILYASSVQCAIDIVNDWVELKYSQPYEIVMAKEFVSCVIINDNLQQVASMQKVTIESFGDVEERPLEDDDSVDNKFYQIDVTICTEETSFPGIFIVETKDIDKAMAVIKNYLDSQERESPVTEIKLEQAKILSFDTFIPFDFSLAYKN